MIGIGIRPDSANTFTSGSSGTQDVPYQESPNLTGPHLPVPNPMGLTRSESDLTQTSMTPTRPRSQSSPQKPGEPATMQPSSGKAPRQVRASPSLHRQDSYHGSSPSPLRPSSLTRANSISGSSSGSSHRRGRPGSLGASVFGFSQITAMPSTGHSIQTPSHSPATSYTSSVGGHSRARSDATQSGMLPFTQNMGSMVLSPDLSESGEMNGMSSQSMVPLTPVTPADGMGVATMIPASEFGQQPQGHLQQQQQQYATMPNKHYQSAQMYGYAQAPTSTVDYSQQQYSQPSSAYPSPLNSSHPVWK